MFVAYAASVMAYWMFRRICATKGLAVTEGLFGSLITVTTIAVGILVLRESLSPRQLGGLALILVGLFLIQ